jgi:hypothetical protein
VTAALIGGTTGLVIVLALVLVVLAQRRVWYGVSPYELAKVKCRHCSAGTQHLNAGDGWGPVPAHILALVRDGGDDIHRSPSANIRKCAQCAGLGYTLVPRDSRKRR